MPNFNDASGIPDGYSSILWDISHNYVRAPDGTLRQAPVNGGSFSLNDIYRGILPNTVGTVAAGGYGGYGNTAPLGQAALTAPPGSIRTAGGMAGTTPMPRGVVPSVVTSLYDQIAASGGQGPTKRLVSTVSVSPQYSADRTTIPGPNGYLDANKAQDRLSPTGALAFDGGGLPSLAAYGGPALEAIERATMPPLPSARPTPPTPNIAPLVYKIKKGDTLSAIARGLGTTVAQLANANNIRNPDKIRAGDSLDLSYLAPPTPHPRPASLSVTSGSAGAKTGPRGYTQSSDPWFNAVTGRG